MAEIVPRLPVALRGDVAKISQVWARANPVEGTMGAEILRERQVTDGWVCLGVDRVGAWPNAVYVSPVP